MKAIKTIEQLEKRLLDLERMHFDVFHQKAVMAVNEYLSYKPYGSEPTDKISKISDNVCLSGAWIYDRVQSKICTHTHRNYKGSLTKKIRKALGFTL